MSYSTMKAGIDAIVAEMVAQRATMQKVKSNAQSASEALGGIPERFADTITAISAISNETADEAEKLLKAQLSQLTDEFVALKQIADTVATIEV